MTQKIHPTLQAITNRIAERSKTTRAAYRGKIRRAQQDKPKRSTISCGNLAHAFAACSAGDKAALSSDTVANLGIVTAYNDMLSAHAPYSDYPAEIKKAAAALGAVAQVAGGVPAMCDGITQGQTGMELSLFSRDVIAMATAVALSHNVFDGVIHLGICDKIVPGLLLGALSFGHLPAIFMPAGPMPSGLPNARKAEVRQLFAEGKVGRPELLKAESQSYHSPGTCTFYGTANTNQMLMEIMGLQLPGSSFVNPGTPLRAALNTHAVASLLRCTTENSPTPLADIVTVKTLVNGMVGLLATGGSTNHTLHLMAIGRAAGIRLTWQDLAALSDLVPLLCRIYPNGLADVNHFQAAGGMGFLINSLLESGLLHNDVKTVLGDGGLSAYTKEPFLEDGRLAWRDAPENSLDDMVLRPVTTPFRADGGLQHLTGNLGSAVIKTSALKDKHMTVTAPAITLSDQNDLQGLFESGALNRDFIAVIRFQGPRANGMPELHKLTPILGILQDKGYQVGLVTDGRMSGASGKIPAAIHLTPEAMADGPIARIEDGDIITIDGRNSRLHIEVPEEIFSARPAAAANLTQNNTGMGRELFSMLRNSASSAEQGASLFTWDEDL
ncbi:phosphogluconate dehydratase [Paremcibacter congregatus]|uniref:phosphogluconate dehydratase n=1 Tax=Paremcibacter congregatus TaxID=2043170 RepID=UPI003A94C8FE